MNVEFTARHFHAPDNLKEYAIKEINRIPKYFDRAIQCQIILYSEHNGYTTELNLSLPSKKFNVKETTDNITKSIDKAVDTMISRVLKFKGKLNNNH